MIVLGPPVACAGLPFQAFAHELLALVAFQLFFACVGIAGFHFVLLGGFTIHRRFGLGAEAGAHEGFALVAFQFFFACVGIAGFHFVLLLGGMDGTSDQQTQGAANGGKQCFHGGSRNSKKWGLKTVAITKDHMVIVWRVCVDWAVECAKQTALV